MTYDERRELDECLDILRKNCQRLERSIDMMSKAIQKFDLKVEKGETNDDET